MELEKPEKENQGQNILENLEKSENFSQEFFQSMTIMFI